MGKRGSWLSAIKRVFAPNSKEKLASEKKGVKERDKKKWGLGKLKHGEPHSFIPLYREPSSIEKILGEAEREQQRTPSLLSREHQRTPSTPTPPLWEHEQSTPPTPTQTNRETAAAISHKSPASMPSRDHLQQHQQTLSLTPRAHHYKAIANQNYHQIAAIKIQTAFRGYMARRSFRALKGLVRLQGVVRGQSVKRQTMNAMRCMQLLVRVQTQIHSRRIQMMENQALQRQKMDKDFESSIGRGALPNPSETDQQEDWDYSLLTKEEIEARMQRKVEAVIKRERALAYAYSHQLWKGNPKSAHNALMEIRSGGGFPWWWNWLERQLPSHALEDTNIVTKNMVTPPKPSTDPDARLTPNKHKQPKFGVVDGQDPAPRSARASPMAKGKHTPIHTIKTPQNNSPAHSKLAKPRNSVDGNSLAATFLRDDESLTSCPAFSVPNYMVPTVSAKAKARAQSIPKERAGTRGSKKRLSFPLGQTIGALFSGKDSASQRIPMNHASLHSIGNVSVDSTLSLPAGVGRKPFQRFV